MNMSILLAILAVTGQSVATPSWSQEQQQVIDVIQRCNTGWVQAIAEEEYLVFDKACPQTRGAAFWYTRGEVPVTHDVLWKNRPKDVKRVSVEDFKPVLVLVNQDVAVVYYSVTWIPERVSGEVTRNRSKRVTALQRQNGTWHLAGGSIGAVE